MNTGNVVVVTDSSAYIPPDVSKGLNIEVIPLWLIWGEECFRDGVDIFPSNFYKRLEKSNTLPTSSQPSAKEFELLFQELAMRTDAIVNVLVSSKISGTIASAQAAIPMIPDAQIGIVDSLSSSMGLGFVVLAAARAAAAGKSFVDVVKAAEVMREKVHLLFVVDTLEYLHRGGRISGGKRLLGTILNIKPILHFEEGEIRPFSQARTKKKAINMMLEIAEDRLEGRPMAEAVIVEINTPEEAEAVELQIRSRFGTSLVHRTEVSPVVGTHVGPGAVGIAFYSE
jgi:DegV family protein with EDD domain